MLQSPLYPVNPYAVPGVLAGRRVKAHQLRVRNNGLPCIWLWRAATSSGAGGLPHTPSRKLPTSSRLRPRSRKRSQRGWYGHTFDSAATACSSCVAAQSGLSSLEACTPLGQEVYHEDVSLGYGERRDIFLCRVGLHASIVPAIACLG
jgi:hypothetical protein